MGKPAHRSDDPSAPPTCGGGGRRRAAGRRGTAPGRAVGGGVARDLDAFSRALVESLVERWIDRATGARAAAAGLDGVRVDDAQVRTLYRAIAVTERRADATRFGCARYTVPFEPDDGDDGAASGIDT